MDLKASDFYQRQTTLPEIGTAGQERLSQAKVLVAGCGGLGAVAAVYLAGSGIGSIHLVDYDEVSVSNLHRQVFYKTVDIGKAKADVLATHIKAINPFIKVSFSKKAIAKNNVKELLAPYDIVLDCTDSLPIKYLLNDACVLTDKILVYGSLYKFDGYVATFNALDNKGKRTANLRDAFPEMPKEYIPNCAEAGTLNSIVGIIGLMQANEVLKLVTQVGKLLSNKLLIYNSLNNSQFIMKLKSLDACHSERQRRISTLFNNETYTDTSCALQDEKLCILASKLKAEINDNQIEIISVINNLDSIIPFKVHQKIPHKVFEINNFKPDSDKKYVIVCNKGITSYDIALKIKEKYPNLAVYSLSGGIENY